MWKAAKQFRIAKKGGFRRGSLQTSMPLLTVVLWVSSVLRSPISLTICKIFWSWHRILQKPPLLKPPFPGSWNNSELPKRGLADRANSSSSSHRHSTAARPGTACSGSFGAHLRTSILKTENFSKKSRRQSRVWSSAQTLLCPTILLRNSYFLSLYS